MLPACFNTYNEGKRETNLVVGVSSAEKSRRLTMVATLKDKASNSLLWD